MAVRSSRTRYGFFASYNRDDFTDDASSPPARTITADNLINQDGSAVANDYVVHNYTDGANERVTDRLFAKLTYNISQSQDLSVSLLDTEYNRDDTSVLKDLAQNYVTNATRYRVNYNYIADWGLVELKYGSQENDTVIGGLTDSGVATRNINTINWRFANIDRFDNQNEKRSDIGARITAFLDTERFGNHEFVAGFEVEKVETDWILGSTGAGEDVFAGDTFDAGTQFTFNYQTAADGRIILDASGNPILNPVELQESRLQKKPSEIEGYGFYIQDRITFDRWTVMAGLRVDESDIIDDLGQTLWTFKSKDFMSPRLSVIRDLSGDQKHILKFGYGIFKDSASTRIAEFFLSEGGNAFRRYGWNGVTDRNATEAELHDPSNWTFLSEQSSETNPALAAPNLKPNENRRYLLEYNWQINDSHAFTTRYVNARSDNLLEDIAYFEDPAVDPEETWTFLLVNWEAKRRDFDSLDMIFKGNFGKLLNYQFSYTWTDSRGTTPNEFENAVLSSTGGSGVFLGVFGDNAGVYEGDNAFNQFVSSLSPGLGGISAGDEGWYGKFSDTPDHAVNFVGNWNLPYGVNLATTLHWVSGFYYTRKGYNDLYGDYQNFVEGRGSRETSDLTWFDFSLARNLSVGNRHDIEFRIDVFNPFNTQGVTQYVQEDTVEFNDPFTRQDPRSVQFGVQYKF